MKLENQVVSLDLAKKLKELGVKQKAMWVYRIAEEGHRIFLAHNEELKIFGSEKYVSAYTVAELGEMLPTEQRDRLGFFSGRAINGWFCEVKNYGVMPYERLHVELQHTTEADARAAMLIYLLENNLITS